MTPSSPSSSAAGRPAAGRVIVSTGIGRLHLLETASAIHASGRPVSLITGWSPGRRQRWLVNALGRVMGQRRLYERLGDRRRLAGLEGCGLAQCPLSEVVITLGSRLGLAGSDRFGAAAWALFGRESRRFIREAQVFHVRSGAGRGGAIARARRWGMRVVADHSIGHPTAMWRNLRDHGAGGPEAEGFAPGSRFWGGVMRDCAEADAVLVNSDYVRETLLEQGFDGRRVHVAYLGVARSWLGVKAVHRPLGGETVRVLFSGHFVRRKGSHVLIAAARRLRAQGAAAQFDVAGQAHDGPAEAAREGVGDLFRFHGLLGADRLRGLVAESDLFAFPTLGEGCAKSAMEALAAGLPVITTRACGLPAAAAACSTQVALGSAEGLAAAIAALAADLGRRQRHGHAGTALVRDHFGPDNFSRAVAALYDQILAGPPAVPSPAPAP